MAQLPVPIIPKEIAETPQDGTGTHTGQFWPCPADTVAPVAELTQEELYQQVYGPVPPPHYIENLRLQFTPEQQEVILAWYPYINMKPSEYLNGKYVTTPQGILMHAEAHQKAQLKQQKQANRQSAAERRAAREQGDQAKGEYFAVWESWRTQCELRKQWIERQKQQWRKRVEERKIAMADWDAYVEDARTAYQTAKATPAPAMPKKDS